jgi:lantibiotic modifying enzyme
VGLAQGVGLCHGIAGNGYAFLTLYRATGELRDLQRAQRFAEYAAAHWRQLRTVPDNPSSLFEVGWSHGGWGGQSSNVST